MFTEDLPRPNVAAFTQDKTSGKQSEFFFISKPKLSFGLQKKMYKIHDRVYQESFVNAITLFVHYFIQNPKIWVILAKILYVLGFPKILPQDDKKSSF